MTLKIATCAPSHNFVGLYLCLQLRHISKMGKSLLNSNMSSTRAYNMVNFGPLTAEIGWGVWGTLANFNGFRVLASYCSDVAQRRPKKLCTMFGRLLGWADTLHIHFRGFLPLSEFCQVQNSLCISTSCLLLYWQRYCTALSSSGR